MKRIFSVLIILTLATLACQLPGLRPLSQPTPVVQTQTDPTPLLVPVNVDVEEGTLSALYQQVIPGVVSIRTGTVDGSGAQGSGFVFDNEGHIVTNQHVVDGASQVEISFSSGYKAYGTVVGFDVDADDVGDARRVDEVRARRAVLVGVVVLPVLHEQADDVEALLLQQPRGDRRVDATRHADDDLAPSRHQPTSVTVASARSIQV